MAKRILLIGGNFSPEPTGIGKYNGEMIYWLANHSFECTVVTTQPYYPQWKVQEPYSNRWYVKETIATSGKKITVYRCPQYVPNQPSGKKRLLQEVSFAASSFITIIRMLAKKKFDYVITVVPPIQLGLHAWLYKKLKGAKFLYHIQDLQIEAARDLGMINSKSLVKGLFRFEKFIMNKADIVSSISPGMMKKVRSKINKEVTFLPNWVELRYFFPLKDTEETRKAYGFSKEDAIVLYSGAIGEKQGLEMILDTAEKLKDQSQIKYLICGSGPYKHNLQEEAIERGLNNVIFIPLQPHEKFNAFLNMADVHLVIQKKGASDLVMPSKLTTILAVGGVALVTAEKNSSLYEMVDQYKMGVLVEPEDQAAFTTALLETIEKDNTVIKHNAREYAEKHLSIDAVLTEYSRHLV